MYQGSGWRCSTIEDKRCPAGLCQVSHYHLLIIRLMKVFIYRTLVVVAEERPRIALCTSFTTLFAPLGLSPRAVSTSFGCRQNIALCLQVLNIY